MCNILASHYNHQRAEGLLPRYLPKTIDKEQDCAICLDKVYDKDKEVQALYHICGKFFHQICIYPWLSIKKSCPHDSAPVNAETLLHCQIDSNGKVTQVEGTLPEVQQQTRSFTYLYWKPKTEDEPG